VDIKIEYTGLRPGEKLYEELLMAEEGLEKTAHEKIFIGKQKDMSFQEVIMCIKALESSMESDEMLRETMARLVPTYRYEKQYHKPVLDDLLKDVKEEKLRAEKTEQAGTETAKAENVKADSSIKPTGIQAPVHG
jgi:hypothetical protein